ncbi:uncharacterized protein L3040_003446 [Drepanopeziza brunnea f. sp. 'multigermtubi']|uniref:uncharacterized protein n=1 Tax=Drepanopeziza brunnea f. sp. 'multigermtubi' TaxID=698441 RepID=UPI002386F18A|nr:hypothetical protein L3040_003446 [Drepanopeziza brunnea f. sp. 'multigermtubi']
MSYSTYSEEDDLDIRIRRGRVSPQPVIFPEHRYRPAPRPYYGEPQHAGTAYLVPAITASAMHRSRSTGHRRPISPPLPSPQQAPIVINNRIYNDYEDDDYLALAPHQRRSSHSRSRSRPQSFVADPRDQYELERTRRELEQYRAVHTRDEYERDKTRRELEAYRAVHTRDEYEMEKTRRELELYKLEKDRQKDEDRMKKHIAAVKEDIELQKAKKELQDYKASKEKAAEEARLKRESEMQRLLAEKKADDERKRAKKEADAVIEKYKTEQAEKAAKEKKEAEEEKKRAKKEADAAIEKYKVEQAEKAAKEKKEKEAREKEYQTRLQEDLRRSGMNERQIAAVLKKDKGIDPNRPTYTRMSRRHLSIETLNRYRIDYEFDQDPDYVLIKRWVPEYEQDFLWTRTREIRERRQPVVLSLEGKKHHHHETELELVRKKKHERKPSPSPLLTFLAGGRR